MKGYFRKVDAKNKKGYTWSFTLDIGKDPATGKRKQLTRRGFETQKEAEKVCNELINQMNKGISVNPKEQSLKGFLTDWLENSAKLKVKDTTFKNYKRAIDSRIIPAIGALKLQELNAVQGQKFIKQLLDEELSARYIEYIYVVLSGALDQAVKWELIIKNPLKQVDIPRARREEKKTWSMEEVNRFLHFAKFDNPIYYHLFLIAIHTGMRRGEVLGLRWKDVDLQQGKISVVQNLIYDEDGFRFGDLKTTGSSRLISVDPNVCAELKSYKAQQNQFKLALGSGYTDLDLLFCREDGRPIYPRTLSDIFNRIIKKADVPKIRFHDLRHTHATLLLKLGENPKIVSERLGHVSIKTTMDTYSHVTPDMQESAAKKFGEALKKTSM